MSLLAPVVTRSGLEDQLFRDTPAEQARYLALEPLFAVAVAILLGEEHRDAEGAAARNDRDLVDGIVRRHQQSDDRVARLVVRGEAFLVVAHHHRTPLGAHHDLVLRLLELLHVDGAPVRPCREQGRFVDEVCEIRTREPRCSPCDHVWLDIAVERYLAHVDFEDLLAAPNVGQRNDDLAIEASRAKQGWIEDVRAVGRGDDNDTFVAFESVHLDEQLIEGLLALVVSSTETCSAVTPDRIDLVDEDDARRVLLGLFEHVAHPRCTDTDEHLDEVRSGDREERDFRLTCDGARKQGLAGSGGPHHQHSARDLAAKLLELRRIAQKVDELGHFLLCLVDPGDIRERHLDLILAEQTRPALAERKRTPTASAALHLTHEEYPHADQQQHREPGNENLHQQRLLLRRARIDDDTVLEQVADQRLVVGLRGCTW